MGGAILLFICFVIYHIIHGFRQKDKAGKGSTTITLEEAAKVMTDPNYQPPDRPTEIANLENVAQWAGWKLNEKLTAVLEKDNSNVRKEAILQPGSLFQWFQGEIDKI